MYFEPSLGEFIDMLTIEHVKELKIREADQERAARIAMLVRDAVTCLTSNDMTFHSKFIAHVMALAQINLCVWNMKESMFCDDSGHTVQLAHQINGLRNQLKNSLNALGRASSGAEKSNNGTDQLKGWGLSILLDGSWPPAVHDSGLSSSYEYRYPLGELVDMLSINQIKEIKFPEEKLATPRENIARLSHDIDAALKGVNVTKELYGLFLECCVLLALLNLSIWENKDQMAATPGETAYKDLLQLSLEMNGLRNYIRNLFLDVFQETRLLGHRATFLKDTAPGAWLLPILQRLEGLSAHIIPVS